MINIVSYNASITFGNLTIYATPIDLEKIQGTRKQIIGGDVRTFTIIDRDVKEWTGRIIGTFYDANRDNDRGILQDYYDNKNTVTLTDGIHDGEYYILSLRWLDDSSNPTEHRFIMEIIQES